MSIKRYRGPSGRQLLGAACRDLSVERQRGPSGRQLLEGAGPSDGTRSGIISLHTSIYLFVSRTCGPLPEPEYRISRTGDSGKGETRHSTNHLPPGPGLGTARGSMRASGRASAASCSQKSLCRHACIYPYIHTFSRQRSDLSPALRRVHATRASLELRHWKTSSTSWVLFPLSHSLSHSLSIFVSPLPVFLSLSRCAYLLPSLPPPSPYIPASQKH